jgi:hypothetical protein
MRYRRFLASLGFVLALSFAASAHAEETAPIVVSQAWARPSLAGASNGVAYVTIVNHGTAPDRLVAITTPVAAMAELHRDEMKDGVMSMRPAGPLPLAPGETASLAPGGLHLMLMGLKQTLKPGETFPLTFTFEKAGAITVTGTIATTAPDAHGAMSHH